MDSTVARAHQHAAGARKKGALRKRPPGRVVDTEPDHGLGRSRGIGYTIPEQADQVRNRKKRGSQVAGRRSSTRSTTASAMRWSAGATG
ncbi:hypothetical protein AB0J28_03210 [Streptosporangium canum]|uniref:hypothetical protein n=1 Tax=Streptosporangium canum TaxID=324952 RepID=UPI0034245DAA